MFAIERTEATLTFFLCFFAQGLCLLQSRARFEPTLVVS